MSVPWIIAFLLLWVVVLLVGLLVVGILRRLSGVLEHAEAVMRLSSASLGAGGLPAGSVVPDFEARDRDEHTITATTLLAEPAIVLFLASDCEPCHRLIADLPSLATEGPLGVELIVVLSEGDTSLRLPTIEGLTVVHQRNRGVATAFDTTATPHAFAVDAAQTIVESTTPNSVEQLQQLALRLQRGGDAHHSADRRVVHA